MKLFRDIDSAITLAFLTRFPDQNKADWLTETRLDNWLASVGYNHRANLARLWTHLHEAPRGATGPGGTARDRITLALVAALRALNTQIDALETQIADQLAAHPDAAIFTSLPRCGCSPRSATPEAGSALACLAGAAPSTRQSGKSKVVTLRRRQAAPRRGHRLRRPLLASQPLGQRPLLESPRTTTRPSTRRPHPRLRLAQHHLALLAGRRPLRPFKTRRPATPRCSSGLTQGYPCRMSAPRSRTALSATRALVAA